jgi:hypothetical protein
MVDVDTFLTTLYVMADAFARPLAPRARAVIADRPPVSLWPLVQCFASEATGVEFP